MGWFDVAVPFSLSYGNFAIARAYLHAIKSSNALWSHFTNCMLGHFIVIFMFMLYVNTTVYLVPSNIYSITAK